MRRFIQWAALFGLLTGLPWTLLANKHEADSGDSTAADASSTPVRIHKHHHPKASPTRSPAPETASSEADSGADVTPARKSRKHHHSVEGEHATESSPAARAVDGVTSRDP